MRELFSIGSVKKQATELSVIEEEKKTELKKVKKDENDQSDGENSDDLELEEQIREAMDIEKKIEKK